MGNVWIAPDIQQQAYGPLGYTMGLSNYNQLVKLNQ